MMKGMEKEDEDAELQKAFEGKSIKKIKLNYSKPRSCHVRVQCKSFFHRKPKYFFEDLFPLKI